MLTDRVSAHKMLNVAGLKEAPVVLLWCWGSLATFAVVVLSMEYDMKHFSVMTDIECE